MDGKVLGVVSDLMTWKKGFYANHHLNISSSACRHTQTDVCTPGQSQIVLFENVLREFLLAKDGLYTVRDKRKIVPQYMPVFA